MVTLPRMLCQPFVSQHVLSTFSCLAKQQNQLFLGNLEKHIPSIIGKPHGNGYLCSSKQMLIICHLLENLSAIQVAGIDDQFEGKKLIANLFFWVKSWTGAENLEQRVPDANVREYVQQIIQLKAIAV